MQLNQREKLLLTLAASVLIPLVLFRFIFFPIIDYQNELVEKIQKTKTKISQVSDLGQRLKYSDRRARKKGDQLSRKIDQLLSQVQIRDNSEVVTDDRYQDGQKIILKLDEITLNDLVRILYKIENHKPGIRIDSMELAPSFKSDKLLRVNFVLLSE